MKVVERETAGRLLREVVQLARAFRKAGQRGREQAITGTRYGFLQHLSTGDARQSELASHFAVSAPAASRSVDSLEAEGLVTRTPDPADARAARVSVTALGRKVLAERHEYLVSCFADEISDWDPEEVAAAQRLLERLQVPIAHTLGLEGPVPWPAKHGEHAPRGEEAHQP